MCFSKRVHCLVASAQATTRHDDTSWQAALLLRPEQLLDRCQTLHDVPLPYVRR